ncbi:MAG TPA: RNA methyltransferase [Syntrophorhabdales bacterium]|nr:RNA methyltransferase [Syntrophorhabdales bacterium]
MGSVYLAIIHYPVLDKRGDTVATSLTNLELHDVARSCMTFGVELCYIVTPLRRQASIAERLIEHWESGYGARYNPDRAQALTKIRIVGDIEEMMRGIRAVGSPVVIGTSSKQGSETVNYEELRAWIQKDDRPFLLLFGTGWGLPPAVTEQCERMLMPIRGKGEYNHLSLRVAIGIILDRLLGETGGDHERDDRPT